MSSDKSSFDAKLERSSLGEVSARKLRERTPRDVVDSISEGAVSRRLQKAPRGSQKPRP